MSITTAVSLPDTELPAIYLNADATAVRGQKYTRLLIRTELVSLIVATLAGVTTWRLGVSRYDALAALSALSFLLAMACALVRAFTRPEENWYAGRAAAESAKTLAWRYAVGGAPFALGESEAAINGRLLERLREVIDQLKDTDLHAPDSAVHEITPLMRKVRDHDIDTRQQVYKRDRIVDQLSWYEHRTKAHAKLAKRWISLVILSSALGVLAAALKFFVIDFDLLGVFSTCATAAIAWNQLNQHRNLASAYAVAASELSIIRDRVDDVPEREWATFVSDCEDAISREHTMWLARHGHIKGASNH